MPRLIEKIRENKTFGLHLTPLCGNTLDILCSDVRQSLTSKHNTFNTIADIPTSYVRINTRPVRAQGN